MDVEPKFLLIETSTEACSIGISKGNVLVSHVFSESGLIHAEKIFPFIKAAFEESSLEPNDLDAIVLSLGPGSYTGLRVGASAVKGLAYGLDIPIIGINVLESLAYGGKTQFSKGEKLYPEFIIPMIDARRMEVFVQVFDGNLNPQGEIEPLILEKTTWNDKFGTKLLVGTGAEKFYSMAEMEGRTDFVLGIKYPSVEYMLELAFKKWSNRIFLDINSFEPLYIKPPNITVSSKTNKN
jgi:tRNA threonylcarbamoyladenosine biosynthesis protein TsaB